MDDPASPITVRLVRARGPQPDERPLDPVRRFVNSRLIEDDVDELGSPAGAVSWFARQGYGALDVGDSALAVYRDVRESLRRALEGDGVALGEINRAMARYLPADPRIVAVDAEIIGVMALAEALDLRFEALQWILASLWRGAASGELSRLKICADDRCRSAFYDGSRNRSRAWCTSGGCGNRNRVARHRARQRASAPGADD